MAMAVPNGFSRGRSFITAMRAWPPMVAGRVSLGVPVVVAGFCKAHGCLIAMRAQLA